MSCANELHGDTSPPWQDKVSALAQLDLCGAKDPPCAAGLVLSAWSVKSNNWQPLANKYMIHIVKKTIINKDSLSQ